jgi:hypothetical protein
MKLFKVFYEQAAEGGTGNPAPAPAPVATSTKENVILPVGDNTTILDNGAPVVKPVETKVNDKPVETPVAELANIDGVDYKLDDKGNALKEDGTVFMTKEQMDSIDNTDDLISKVEKITNIIINDPDGKPITYDSTPEGLAKRELDIVSHIKSVTAKESISGFLQSNPDINAMYEYKQKNGTLEGFGTKLDYSTIKVDKSDKTQLKQFIIEDQLSRGNSLDVAKSFADFAEKNNQLEKLGLDSYNILKTNQETQFKDRQKKIKESNNRYYGADVDSAGNLKDLKVEGSLYDMIINKGEFNGLKLPKDGFILKGKDGATKVTPQDLFAYSAFSADANGNSQLDLLVNNYLKSPANKLTIGMYILKGGDLSELATNAAATANAKRIIISTKNKGIITQPIISGNPGDKEKLVLPVQ